ncbi:MAG: hypothetical protein WEA61_09210 [Anaerolineales bacterium]
MRSDYSRSDFRSTLSAHLTVASAGSYHDPVHRLTPFLLLLLLTQCVTGAAPRGPGPEAGAHAYTWDLEFDYVSWVGDAALLKLGQGSLGPERYLDEGAQKQLVLDTMALIQDIQVSEGQLRVLHADPDPGAVKTQIEELNAHLDGLYYRRGELAPLAESILQAQISSVFAEQGFTFLGQPLPPLLFHGTPLPSNLIASPRERIAQVANISLRTELTLDAHIAIEDEVAEELNLSTLVVPVGGIGVYPTMVAQTSNVNWLAEVVSHEWMHNYLTLRPLGLLYFQNPALTTMNETAANIVGREIGQAVIARYYPELVPPPPAPAPQASAEDSPPPSPAFDFNTEMHATRVQVDALLAEGKVEEAEEYMETRRLFFWDNGYAIRKLNQAYFAFYGSYADAPIGAAGEDPVGAAVRELRTRSSSLKEFVSRMAWLTSFEDLQKLLASLN